MPYLYQHLPDFINPIAISISGFEIRWYSLMYLAAFLTVYFLLRYRIKNCECLPISRKLEINKPSENTVMKKYIAENLVVDYLIYSFIGLIIGARLGHVFLYNLEYFISNPLDIIYPFNETGNFTGIFGMSYFGGLFGIIVSSLIFCKKRKINFWKWADFVVPAIPAGYFFGRMGNFLNLELYGKITKNFLGMNFPFDFGLMRHPTQLYESFGEGLFLFLLLWLLRNKSKFPGQLLCIYLFGYGVIRFAIEFLRDEATIIFGITTGQTLAAGMILAALILYFCKRASLPKTNP